MPLRVLLSSTITNALENEHIALQVGPTGAKLEYIPDSRTPQRSFLGGLFGGSSSSATRKQ